ncbi:HAT dimerization, partial [Penicillium viridicatum]
SIKETIQYIPEREQIKYLTSLNLPFRILKRKQFASLIRIAQKALAKPTLLYPQIGRRGVIYNSRYLTIRYEALNRPRLLDIAFLVGIYSNYRVLYRPRLELPAYSGINLSEVLIEIFKKLDITDRILAIILDNVSNNITLLSLRELLRSVKADP